MHHMCQIWIEGVPNKNLKSLFKKPLIAYSIEQAVNSKLFTTIMVSTDSNEIAKKAKMYGAKSWFLRPKKLSTNSSPKLPVIKHALKMAEKEFGLKYDIVVDLDVSSPLRTIEDIKKSLKKFKDSNYSNLITGCKSRKNPYFNIVELKNGKANLSKKSKSTPTRRQSAPKAYDMNASIYIWKRATLLKSKLLFNANTGFYEMPEERSYDIDSKLDWDIVEMIMKKMNHND